MTQTRTVSAAGAPEQVVRGMFDAVYAQDWSAFQDAWAPDALWHNMPMSPIRGREQFARWWRPFFAEGASFRAELHHVAVHGDSVLTERTDHCRLKGVSLQIPVSGTFRVREGRIVENREYWDLAQFLGRLVRAALGRSA